MKAPNYDKTVGKHPIPHAKGIGKDETSNIEKNKSDEEKKKKITEYKEDSNEEKES